MVVVTGTVVEVVLVLTSGRASSEGSSRPGEFEAEPAALALPCCSSEEPHAEMATTSSKKKAVALAAREALPAPSIDRRFEKITPVRRYRGSLQL